jgi:hypothetical protein
MILRGFYTKYLALNYSYAIEVFQRYYTCLVTKNKTFKIEKRQYQTNTQFAKFFF